MSETVYSAQPSPSKSNDNASSEDELPIPRTHTSSSSSRHSPSTTSKANISFASTDVKLPYPLQLKADYMQRIGLNFDEFIEYCSSNPDVSMMVDPIELVCEFIDYRRRNTSTFGLNEECLRHLMHTRTIEDDGEPFESHLFEYVTTQILKTIDYPNFDLESPPNDQWSRISCTCVDSSTLANTEHQLNVFRIRRIPNREAFGNSHVFDLLASNASDKEDVVRLYHGTDIDSVKEICRYGIDLHVNHRLGTDFGPGMYVTDVFDNALFIANMRCLRNKMLGAVICFAVSRTELNQLSIFDLRIGTQHTDDPLEWSNFVRLCRRNLVEYPHRFRQDGVRGPICNNAEKVLHKDERPQMKNVNGRKPIQICVKSTSMAHRLETSVFGIYVFGVSTS